MAAVSRVRINPTGELPEPLPIPETGPALTAIDKFEATPTDQADHERQFPQLKAQYLIDRDGIVRWANMECAEGITGVGKFPSDEVILTAAKALSS